MKTVNLSEESVKNVELEKKSINPIDLNKSTKISLEDKKPNCEQSRLTFTDGFNFGLGFVLAIATVYIVVFLFIALLGVSVMSLLRV